MRSLIDRITAVALALATVAVVSTAIAAVLPAPAEPAAISLQELRPSI